MFSQKLLSNGYEQYTRSSITNVAWAGGLWAAFETQYKMVLSDFSCPECPDLAQHSFIQMDMVIQLGDTNHHSVAMMYQVYSFIPSTIKEADQGTVWKEDQPVNICPPCINFSDGDKDCIIRKTMHGSMQHAWLKSNMLWNLKIFKPEHFFDNGSRKFNRAMNANEQDNTMILSDMYGHRFKPTDGLHWPESITTTMKEYDNSGTVGVACFEYLNRRFLNIYCASIWQSRSIRLRNPMLHEIPHFAEQKLCYDVGCVFQSARSCDNLDTMVWAED